MNNADVLISVIVPVYNAEKYLEECLDSLIGQTHKNIEIILINDGSTDRSADICRRYKKKDQRIVLIEQENAGISCARNRGIDTSSGEWLMFTDSDDHVDRTFCERPLELVSEKDCEIAAFGFRVFDEWGNQRNSKTDDKYLGRSDKKKALFALASQQIFDYAWNKIYHRSLFEKVRYPEGELYEDIAVSYLLFNESRHVYVSNDILYHYRRREGSLLDMLDGSIDEKMKQRDKELAFFLEHDPAAALEVERGMLDDELSFCIRKYSQRKTVPEYKRIKNRIIKEHPQILKKFGMKKYLLQKSLMISESLFYLMSYNRRRHFKRVAEINRKRQEESGT